MTTSCIEVQTDDSSGGGEQRLLPHQPPTRHSCAEEGEAIVLARKYADAKRRLQECVALLRDYEQVNRWGEQRVRACQHEAQEARARVEQLQAKVGYRAGRIAWMSASCAMRSSTRPSSS